MCRLKQEVGLFYQKCLRQQISMFFSISCMFYTISLISKIIELQEQSLMFTKSTNILLKEI